MDIEELKNRFAYHRPTDPSISDAHEAVRVRVLELALWFNELLVDGREKAQALTDLDDAAMHANASIARNQRVSGSSS